MTLYRVDTYATFASWTDITPEGDFAPFYPYSVYVDISDINRVVMVASNGTAGGDGTQKLFETLDQGANWTDLTDTTTEYTGVKSVAEIMYAFGDNAINFSADAGATVSNKLGDWSSVIGTVGIIRGVWIIS